jgi:sialate O-acetylesterase
MYSYNCAELMRKPLSFLPLNPLYPIVLILASVFALPTFADVRLPKIFGSHMVLQRDSPLPIWGWAGPGEQISVEFLGQIDSTSANAQGEWKVELPPAKAGGPHTLTVIGTNSIELQNVLVGEVWLCSGQSNMEMGVGLCLNPEAEIAAANHPHIRLFQIPKKLSAEPQTDIEADWNLCTSETIAKGGWGGFSAAAYYFGRHLQRELDVPIGLIQAAWGGTRIEPWIPPAGFAAVPAVRDIYEQLQLQNPRSDLYKARLGGVLDEVAAWLNAARAARQSEEPVPKMPTYPPELLPPNGPQQPAVLYNAMIHPLVPFALRGAIWYQGESNHNEGMLYTEKMKALIGGWRGLWPNGEFPFYYVQIAPYSYGGEASDVLPKFWEAQTAALEIPHTGMVIIHDVGDLNDIHPKNKQEVGRRLALVALAKTYNQEVIYSGPLYRSMQIKGDKIHLRFDHGGGLKTRDGATPNHFAMIDQERGGFVRANAKIVGDEVVVSAPGVEHPVAVRFAWHKLAEPNLVNAADLPATPFRAGVVPQRDRLKMEVPEAADYHLVYDLDLANLGADIHYDIDNSAAITSSFDRIAYFVELQRSDGETRFLYVSLDAFTDNLKMIGVPTLASGAHFQQPVTRMNIWSNTGAHNGIGLEEGHIEFWPNNYTPANSSAVPNASQHSYDFGDQPIDPADGYGSMQIHNATTEQTLFAINHWRRGGRADIGIGNRADKHSDWTFAGNAQSYSAKRLRVLVRLDR